MWNNRLYQSIPKSIIDIHPQRSRPTSLRIGHFVDSISSWLFKRGVKRENSGHKFRRSVISLSRLLGQKRLWNFKKITLITKRRKILVLEIQRPCMRRAYYFCKLSLKDIVLLLSLIWMLVSNSLTTAGRHIWWFVSSCLIAQWIVFIFLFACWFLFEKSVQLALHTIFISNWHFSNQISHF